MSNKNFVKVLLIAISLVYLVSCGGVGKYCSKDGSYCLAFGGGTVDAGPKSDAKWPVGSFPWEYGADSSEIFFKLPDGKNVTCKLSTDVATISCTGGGFGSEKVTLNIKK